MTSEAKPINARWRRVLRLAFRIYAGICTLLITTYLGFVVWSIFHPESPTQSMEAALKYSYDQYMQKEFPRKGTYFFTLSGYLAAYSRQVPVRTADLVMYLGKPDRIAGTDQAGAAAYLFNYDGVTNQEVMFAFLKDGKLTSIGYNGSAASNLSAMHPYPK